MLFRSAHQAAQADLQNRIDKARQAGQAAEADKLQQDLDKLMQQAPQMDQLKDLAQQMGQCAKCLRDGQPQDAADALKNLQAGVNDMQKQLDELEMLEDAMGQMAQAKDQMNCPMCGGAGCQACQGDKPGFGMGRGRGQGDRPEADSETSAYDSQVRQRIGAGAADVVDLVDGPNVKGNVEQQIKEQFDSVKHVSADPQTDRNIPRQHRQQAREYFDRLREGE